MSDIDSFCNISNSLNVQYLDNKEIYNKLQDDISFRPHITNTTHIEYSNNSIPVISFNIFDKLDFIKDGFSTRLGGISSGIYSTLNLTYNLDDARANVDENFRRIGAALGISPSAMVYSKQTHTTNVLKVDKNQAGMGIIKQRAFDNIDGLITNEPGLCLVTSYADCVPLYFVDPVNKCIGLSHAGWRGTVGNIVAKTIELMTKEYGSSPGDIIAQTGPCICKNCYEVSKDVWSEFNLKYIKDELDKFIQPSKSKGKYLLNLPLANYYNMIHSGLKSENIGISDICTNCNSSLLFSHRATKGKRGIQCAFLSINNYY